MGGMGGNYQAVLSGGETRASTHQDRKHARMYLLQCWFSLSDEGVEDAINHMTVASKLLREDDEVVYGDSAYLGLEKREEIKYSPQLSAIEYRISRRPGRLPKVSDNAIDWERYIENRKSSVRCKVEHPYRIVKNIFGFRKTVYRGLRKNLNRLHVLFAGANLYMLAWAGGSLRPAWDPCAL